MSNEDEDSLRHHLRTANEAARRLAGELGQLRIAVERAHDCSERIAASSQHDYDRDSRLVLAASELEEMSAGLTSVCKRLAPLCREALRGSVVAKSR